VDFAYLTALRCVLCCGVLWGGVAFQIVTFLRRAGLRVCFLKESKQHPGRIVVLITAEPYQQVVQNYAGFKSTIKKRQSENAARAKLQHSTSPDDVLLPALGLGATTSTTSATPKRTPKHRRGSRTPLNPRRVPRPGHGPVVCRGMKPDGQLDEASMTLLQRENLKLYNERYLKFGMHSQATMPPDFFDMTTAKKLMLTHKLIVDAIDRVNLENHGSTSYSRSNRHLVDSQHELLNTLEDNVQSAWDYVERLFPLHGECAAS